MTLFKDQTRTVIQPRKYQLDAFAAVKTYLEYRDGNPCVVLPTGAGKTILIVLLCQWVQSWGGRVLILSHVRELLQQSADKLNAMGPDLNVGIYSAGLNRRDKRGDITVAGIQSIYQKADEFEPWDLVIVDECHLIPADGEGMYRSFLGDARNRNPQMRLVGLTATPYRMTSGELCGPDEMLTAVCYEVGVMDLITDGYLCPLKSKRVVECDTSNLHVRGGEFVADEVSLLMAATNVVELAVQEIIERTGDRRSVLIFCCSVEHAEKVLSLIEVAELITGETRDREAIIARFKSGQTKYLVNVNVLTTGFDAPNVDCVVLLRPTLSAGLYYQMCGRGFRLAEGKQDCLILDFGGNIQRHGPINAIRVSTKRVGKGKGVAPTHVCPDCDEVVHLNVKNCPACGYAWPVESNPKHHYSSGNDSIIDEEYAEEESSVIEVYYSKHHKKNAPLDHPATLRVDYKISLTQTVSEWVCIEHDGFAGNKARLWWSRRSADPFPPSVNRAVEIAEGGGLARPLKVRHKPDGKYTRITKVELGPVPAGVEQCECGGAGCEACSFDFRDVVPASTEIDFDDLPF